MANSGVNVWGYKRHPKYALAWQVNNQKVPVYSSMRIKADIDLDDLWLGDPNVSVTWSSNHPDIIDEHGHYNGTGIQEETEVTLTARITAGTWYWQNEYVVKAQPNPNTNSVGYLPSTFFQPVTPAFDLQGRRVEKPRKGIFIINGKLTIIR